LDKLATGKLELKLIFDTAIPHLSLFSVVRFA
jgi:hypothetical protein